MSKYKFIHKKINLTDEQINKYKNFDQLYNTYQQLPNGLSGKIANLPMALKIALPMAASIAIFIAAWFMLKPIEDTRDQVMAYNTEKPFIASPIPEYDIPFAIYNIDANKDFKLIYEQSGSTINIPKNAFVDENGNSIKGAIEIKYREFENPKTFFRAGIPMTYNESGQQYHFESAGMMEIRAFQDDKEIFLNKDHSLSVNMTATNTGDNFKLYFLDENKRTWVDEGEFDVKDISSTNKAESRTKIPTNNLDLNYIKTQLDLIAPLPPKPSEPVKADEQKYRFTLEYEADEFPELKAYDGITFELEDGQGFKPAYYDITYDKIELRRINNHNKYEIILSKGKNKKIFKSYPVFEGSTFEKAQIKFKKLEAQYQVALLKRKQEKERLKAEALRNRENQRAAILKEQAARQEAYQKYLTSLSDEQRVYASAMNVFSIKKTGIWNCDRKLNYPKGQILIAQFSDLFGEKLQAQKIYLVQEGRNALFTYDINNFNQFQYNPKKRNMLWTVLPSGKLGVFKSDDFEKIEIGSSYHNFHLTTYDIATIKKEGIGNLLSFEENS